MKNVILHGENQVESRKKLSLLISQAKKDGLDVQRLDGKGLAKGDLLMAAREQSLLSSGRLVVVEGFFANNKKAVEIVGEAAKADGVHFVFWEKSTLALSAVKRLLNTAQVEEFKIPKSIFKFLDSLAGGELRNVRASLELLHGSLKNSDAEFVFMMLARQVRLLIWVKLDPDTLNIPDWQKRKLVSQARNFTRDRLFSLHEKLLVLDRMNKHSQLPEGLSASLELLVAEI